MGDWAEANGNNNFWVSRDDLSEVCDAIDRANGWSTASIADLQRRLQMQLDDICHLLRPEFDELRNWIGIIPGDFRFASEETALLRPIAPWVKPNSPNLGKSADTAYVEYERPGELFQWAWRNGEFFYRHGNVGVEWQRSNL